jgi:hypothetical protein
VVALSYAKAAIQTITAVTTHTPENTRMIKVHHPVKLIPTGEEKDYERGRIH